MSLTRITLTHSALTDTLYLVRLGHGDEVVLDKRPIEPQLMQALIEHMTHGMSQGSRKDVCLNGHWYEVQVRPIDAPQDEQVTTDPEIHDQGSWV